MSPRPGSKVSLQSSRLRIKHSLLPALILVVISVNLVVTYAPPAVAVGNGDVISSAPPWAAFITTNTDFLGHNLAVESQCTGSIISKHWVLTAAHCLLEEDSHGHHTSTPIDLAKIRVVLGRSSLTNTFQGGQYTTSYTQIDIGRDVALIKLDGELPRKALPLALAPDGLQITDNTGVTAYGYGNTSEKYDSNGNITDQTDSTVLRATKTGSYVTKTSCGNEMFLCLQRNGPSELYHGDSGGPVVLGSAPELVQVGVTSILVTLQRGANQVGTWAFAGAARVSEHQEHAWIQGIAEIATGETGTVYRNSTTWGGVDV